MPPAQDRESDAGCDRAGPRRGRRADGRRRRDEPDRDARRLLQLAEHSRPLRARRERQARRPVGHAAHLPPRRVRRVHLGPARRPHQARPRQGFREGDAGGFDFALTGEGTVPVMSFIELLEAGGLSTASSTSSGRRAGIREIPEPEVALPHFARFMAGKAVAVAAPDGDPVARGAGDAICSALAPRGAKRRRSVAMRKWGAGLRADLPGDRADRADDGLSGHPDALLQRQQGAASDASDDLCRLRQLRAHPPRSRDRAAPSSARSSGSSATVALRMVLGLRRRPDLQCQGARHRLDARARDPALDDSLGGRRQSLALDRADRRRRAQPDAALAGASATGRSTGSADPDTAMLDRHRRLFLGRLPVRDAAHPGPAAGPARRAQRGRQGRRRQLVADLPLHHRCPRSRACSSSR